MVGENLSGTRRTVLKGLGAAACGTAVGGGSALIAAADDTAEWVHEDKSTKYEEFAENDPKPDIDNSSRHGVGRIGASVHRTLSLWTYNINKEPSAGIDAERSYEFEFSLTSFGAGLWREWRQLGTDDAYMTEGKEVPSLFDPYHMMKVRIQNVDQKKYFRSDDGASLGALRSLTDDLSVDGTSDDEWVTEKDLSKVDDSNYDFGGKYVSGAGLALGVGSTIASGGIGSILSGAGILLSAVSTAEAMDRDDHGIEPEENDQHYKKEWKTQNTYPGFLASIYFQVEVPKGESWTMEVIDDYKTDDPVYVQQSDTSELDDMLRNNEEDLFLVDIPENNTDQRDEVNLPQVF